MSTKNVFQLVILINITIILISYQKEVNIDVSNINDKFLLLSQILTLSKRDENYTPGNYHIVIVGILDLSEIKVSFSKDNKQYTFTNLKLDLFTYNPGKENIMLTKLCKELAKSSLDHVSELYFGGKAIILQPNGDIKFISNEFTMNNLIETIKCKDGEIEAVVSKKAKLILRNIKIERNKNHFILKSNRVSPELFLCAPFSVHEDGEKNKDRERSKVLSGVNESDSFKYGDKTNDKILENTMETNVFGVYDILKWVEPIDKNIKILNIIFEKNKKILNTVVENNKEIANKVVENNKYTVYSTRDIWHNVGMTALVVVPIFLTFIITSIGCLYIEKRIKRNKE